MKILKRLLTLAAVASLFSLTSGCSNSDSQVNASGVKATAQSSSQMEEPMDEGFPVTLQTGSGELVLETQPVRILSLSPTATEILFAIGAGEQVFAVDDQSNYPPGAPISDISGWSPNLEAILDVEIGRASCRERV